MGHDLSQDAEIWDDAYKLDRAHVFIRGTHSATWIPLKW